MPIDVNKRESYIIIGNGVSGTNLTNPLHLPVPTTLPFSDEFLVDAERSAATGALIAQQIGRKQYKSEIGWAFMDNRTMWGMNRWFETFGYFFYMKYFSHSDGKIKIHRFYRGNAKQATPGTEQETIDGVVVPRKYFDVGYSVIDMGEQNVIIVQTLGI